MSVYDLMTHNLLIKHPDPSASPDGTGQLFVDETGQPIGDATTVDTDWSTAVSVRGAVQELTARWPEGPGAGPELVDTKIFLPFGTAVRELDKIRDENDQAYQAMFVRDAAGLQHHLVVQARRIPL